MMISTTAPIVATVAPGILFGLTLSQTITIGLLAVIAVASVFSAVVLTSKYFAVKYVSVEDKEALEFSREMRNYFRDAVHHHIETTPPWEENANLTVPKALNKDSEG